ncbi:hypothetical protein BRD19_07885 [Halobacteriales archaeon SW_7_65_23]|nr:MAG: hypothetical protein BRD19_07885 [Halobacteriales archaeon SW_7_65_23]
MRGQSHVVGVALLLGIAIVALGGLTVGVGSLLDAQAATADANRVADGMNQAFQGIDRAGTHSQRIAFSDGHLATEERTLRIIKNGRVLKTREVDALVFERGDRRVAAVAGALVQQHGASAWLVSAPRITDSERNDVFVVGAPILNASHVTVGGTGGVSRTLRIDPSHTEHDLGTGEFAVAIETATPGPFERYFEEQNASTNRRTFAGDEHASVVAHYPGDRQGYLVVHDLSMEVDNG